MAATGIGPVARPEPFSGGTTLQQQAAGIVEQENGKRPVQDARTLVRITLRKMTDLVVMFVDEYQLLAFRRDDSVHRVHANSSWSLKVR
jgi:hypothetical protein